MRHRTTGRVGDRQHDDSGFTLVEAVVALFVLATIFTALAAAAMGSLRASMTARAEQQAIDFATEALEKTRAADYYSLANVSADVSGDPRVSACGSDKCIDPGTGTAEPLVLSATGSVNPHVSAVNLDLANNVTMNLYTYITRPADSTADYKRVTVVAKWQVAGHQRERAVSSLVTVTDRGLPLPVFKITPLGGTSASVNPDTDVPFGFELTNQGAPDRWNLVLHGKRPDQVDPLPRRRGRGLGGGHDRCPPDQHQLRGRCAHRHGPHRPDGVGRVLGGARGGRHRHLPATTGPR